jgi:hypothetical protein
MGVPDVQYAVANRENGISRYMEMLCVIRAECHQSCVR